MSNFQMDPDYIDVAERIAEFRRKHPEGSLDSELFPLPDAFASSFVAVLARAFRTPDDPRPGVGLAWEPVPGKTPFTKDSELANCQTSAWGRAIVAVLAADTKRGVASKQEVRSAAGKRDAESATGGRPSSGGKPVAPSRSGGKASSPPSGQTTDAPSPSSTTPSSDAGLREAFGEGASTSPASGTCAHEWIAAPRAGFQACKKCGLGRKGSK